jgi:Na+/proline symporter
VVAFVYTAIGGFRAVIVTDRFQMISIWLLLLSLPVFYIYYVITHGGWAENFARIPAGTLNFSYREGLFSFLLGIFVINVPTFISDMSIWQRIAGAQKNQTVVGGLWRSVFSAAATWGFFALLACFVFLVIRPAEGVNPLVSVLKVIGTTGGFISIAVLFLAVLGLYGAMLSTASTQLIAVSHTLYEDVFSHMRKSSLAERLESKKELHISRTILVLAAIFSTLLVMVLARAGFSIVDLVFAIYGAQLGLCPLVISALLFDREHLKKVSLWAAMAISAGFVTGWGTAIIGRLTSNTNLVFLAPVMSLIVSTLLLCFGFLVSKTKRPQI